MRIVLCFRQDVRAGKPVECYANSFLRVLQKLKHNVTTVGEGHDRGFLGELNEKNFDLLIEIENGRNSQGELVFQQSLANWTLPSVVWLIDVHSGSGVYGHVAPNYKHVFFAPWIKRDVFKDHSSAHWLPNTSDTRWFDREHFTEVQCQFEWGFHSSKMGLARADRLVDVCKRRNWSCDVRQVTKAGRQRWPSMGEAMSACANLYNWGQKQDGPNQRVIESMLTGRPLLNDLSALDGMSKLFSEGKHFIGYRRDGADLEEKMEFIMNNTETCKSIAESAYQEAKSKHLIEHRVASILEVVS